MAETPNDPYAVVNRNTGLYDLATNPNTYNLEGFHPASGDGGKDCNDYAAWGNGSTIYSYIVKSNANPDTYPEEACDPYYHQTGQIDNLRVNVDLQGPNGTGAFNINSTLVSFSGDVQVAGIIYSQDDSWSISGAGFTGAVSGNITGDISGDVTGNVTGDVTGNLTGNVTGGVTGDVTGNVVGIVTTPSITLGSVAITATGTEINYTDGVTSNIQTQLDATISLSTLKTTVAASTDFADFKTRVAALT